MDLLVRNNEAASFISTSNGDVVTISNFISQLDEAAATRLQRMNQRLRDLEMQMELLESEICKTTYDPYKDLMQFPPSLVNGFEA
ncbi:hypothetical protein FCM35_KLT15609 [Carex littledalei]|uniref:Uncharacterized protein n=1 Tax=Carex littledalei TaxID=544730 RepID=A0A833VXK0_9POAL|nr:hypothetical protein FCM35_KLT15609 [Carex littledalei]